MGKIADTLGPLTPMRTTRGSVAPISPFGRLDAQTLRRPDVQTASRSGLPLQGTAKSKHPDFAKKTWYIRKSTMRDAMRRYEDAGGAEESELIELLLQRYVSGRLDV